MVCYQYHIQRKNAFNDWDDDQVAQVFKRNDERYKKLLKKGEKLVLYIKEWDDKIKETVDLIDIITL
jgi:hypothetical protein